MIIHGRVICNLCGCDMGQVYGLLAAQFHVCPDCQERFID